MGNRAIITAEPFDKKAVGIYVHWNGGYASVKGFCDAARELGYRSPDGDAAYGLARLTQAIGQFFGGAESLGIGLVKHLASENGIYVIGKDWQIVERRAFGGDYAVVAELAPAPGDEVDDGKSAEVAAAIVRKVRAGEACE